MYQNCQIIRVSKRSGNMKNGEYKYDNNYDNLDIKVLKPFVHDKTVEIAEGVLLDFGENNTPISRNFRCITKVEYFKRFFKKYY